MSAAKILFRIGKLLLSLVLLIGLALFVFFFITTSVSASIDDYEYELPFKNGERCRVIQGYGGLFTHNHIAALDFDMPVGSPVYAAREGTVYNYKNDSDEGGLFAKYKRKANYIIIKHDDGSFGCYWHLQKNGVLVTQGRILKGQQIGLSGATGQVLRPHLHFSVKNKLNYQKDSFRRTRFRTTAGWILLKQGRVYERPGI